jgi:uncharacterized Fe-S cluster-containing radical SAM superfamily protein
MHGVEVLPRMPSNYAHFLRARIVRPESEQCLLARIEGSEESKDKYTEINCGGYGRVRQFATFAMHAGNDSSRSSARSRSFLAPGFGFNPIVRTQVFQLAGCSWRCWYCYVDYALLSGNAKKGAFFSASDLVRLYFAQTPRAEVIDLSGGQPDLVPEWPLWMLRALDKQPFTGRVIVRSEDNLSNMWLWKLLNAPSLDYLATHKSYVRIGCLKGFDPESFAFNTGDTPDNFERQFAVIDKLVRSRFQLYLYATFTGTNRATMKTSLRNLCDRLQRIHHMLPLRTMPLRIRPTPAMDQRRSKSRLQFANDIQNEAFSRWQEELERRFSGNELQIPIGDVELLVS